MASPAIRRGALSGNQPVRFERLQQPAGIAGIETEPAAQLTQRADALRDDAAEAANPPDRVLVLNP